MRVTVAVDGDDTRLALESLFGWLRHEDVFRGRLQVRPSTVAPEAMGTLDDALIVALSGGGAAAVLARSLAEWVKQRTSDVRLTLTRPTGETLSVDGRRIRNTDTLIDVVARFVDEHDSDSDETS